ncbi:hypothetical protein CRG98_023956 [Punica granatum]|uniref:Uncharacterized protein n=1 Tax=Punica granatum TaxID=22663 RepID=A0A2I0JHD0_PUNGR|nr:hypothetical protein CRG98_023956 [Punica granatum]
MEGADIWEAVEDDYEVADLPTNPTINKIRYYKERVTGKAKAKLCLCLAVSPTIFTRIMRLKSAKDIWDYLKEEYEGDEKIRERFEATIASLENTKEVSDIKLVEVLSALQAQEQRSMMRRNAPVEGAL